MLNISEIVNGIVYNSDQAFLFGLCLLFLVRIFSGYQRWMPWCTRHPLLTDTLIVTGCLGFFLAPLGQSGAPGGHDIYFHLSRVAEMHRLVQDGYFDGRWTPNFNYGFGYPLFNFYPSLIYYLAQPFRMLGAGTVDALHWVIIGGTWLSAFFMYLLGKEFWGRYGGVVCAVAYTYIPYRIVNLYVRGAIPELFAMTFMPLIFWSFYNISRTQKLRYIIIGAVSYGLIIPSHNVTAVFFTFCLIGYSLFLLWDLRLMNDLRGKSIVKTALSLLFTAILGISLMTVYWLPALYEKQFVKISSLHSGYHDVAMHFVSFPQFFSQFWGYGGSGKGANDGMSFQLGMGHVLIVAISLLVVFALRHVYPRQRNHSIFYLGMLGSLVFSMTSRSLPIWRTFPLIGFISFPWRLLSLTGFALSFLCGGLFLVNFDAWRTRRFTLPYPNRIVQFSVIGFLLFFTVGYCRVGNPLPMTDKQLSPESIRTARGAAINNEYLPIWAEISSRKIQDIQSGEIQIMSGEAQIEDDVQTDMLSYRFTIHVNTSSLLRLGTLYFPGWNGYDNGIPLPLQPEEPSGLVTAKLPPGTHRIVIRFEDTFIRTFSRYISIGALGVFCILLVLHSTRQI